MKRLLLYIIIIASASSCGVSGKLKYVRHKKVKSTEVTANLTQEKIDLPSKTMVQLLFENPPCDTLFLVNGEKIFGAITVTGRELVRYEKCGDESGGGSSINKSELRAIHFSSGTILTFDKKGNSVRTEQSMEIKQIETSNNSLNESEEKEENKRKPSKKEQEYFNRQSNVSLIFGFLSLIPVIGCVFSMIAIVSGNVLLNKTEHIANQDKTRKKARIGRGLGTMTIVLGTMIVLAMLIFLVLL